MKKEKFIKRLRKHVWKICFSAKKLPENDILDSYWDYFETFLKSNSTTQIKEKLFLSKKAQLLEKYIDQYPEYIQPVSYQDEENIFRYIIEKMKDDLTLSNYIENYTPDQFDEIQSKFNEHQTRRLLKMAARGNKENNLNLKQIEKFEGKLFLLRKDIKKLEKAIMQSDVGEQLEKLKAKLKERKRKFKLVKNMIKFQIIGVLKSDERAKVYLLIDKKKKRFVIFKIIFLEGEKWSFEKRKQGEKNVESIFHKKIIEVYNTFKNKQMYVTELEYFPGISLNICHNIVNNWSIPKKLLLLKEIIQVIKTLHISNRVHFNIKPENILINVFNNKIEIKIIDFRLSLKVSRTIENFTTSRIGMEAPETQGFDKVKLTEKGAKAIDIWMFAYMAYNFIGMPLFVLSEDVHFKALESNNFTFFQEIFIEAGYSFPEVYQIKNKENHYSLQGEEIHYLFIKDTKDIKVYFASPEAPFSPILAFPIDLDQGVYDIIITEALSPNPQERPTAQDINDALKLSHHQYTMGRSLRMHGILNSQLDHFSNSGNSGIISVITENGNAEIVFNEGVLVSAKFGDLRGKEVLEELIDEVTVITDVSHIYKTILGDFSQKPVNVTDFLLNCANYNDILREYRGELQTFIREHLGIGEYTKCFGFEGECCSQKTKPWSYNNLIFGTNIFICTIGQRILVLCKDCIKTISQTLSQSIPPTFKKFESILMNKGNFNNEFYMCFKERTPHVGIYCSKPSLAKSMYRSYRILRKYPCRYFIKLSDFYDVKGTKTGFLLTEYFPSLSLLRLFNENSALNESLKIFILYELSRAIHSLHRKNIVHRKITFSSILLGVNGQVKLGDFTLCKVVEQMKVDETININMKLDFEEGDIVIGELVGKTNVLGVMEYCSPEFRKNMSHVTPDTDIWSWGVVAYKLISGEFPFKAYNCRRGHYTSPDFDILQFENEKNEILRELIQRSLQIIPETRPTAQEIEDTLQRLVFP